MDTENMGNDIELRKQIRIFLKKKFFFQNP